MRSFDELRDECLEKGELWEDPDFPATQASVFYHQTPPFAFEWKRPNVSKDDDDDDQFKDKRDIELDLHVAGIRRRSRLHLVRVPDCAGKAG
jgi:hypothetical protein